MLFFVALIMGVFAVLAGKAGMKSAAKFFGVIAFLSFMAWLSGGAGATILNWIDDPMGAVPDSVPIPGQ